MKILTYEEMAKLEPCVDITEEDISVVHDTAKKMIELCVSSGGVGLAAPQVGVNGKFFIYSPDGSSYHIVINPSYYPAEKKKTKSVEQCLSLGKDDFYFVERNKYITTKFYGISPNGSKLVDSSRRMHGEEAIIFAHECDHLKGISIKDIGEKI